MLEQYVGKKEGMLGIYIRFATPTSPVQILAPITSVMVLVRSSRFSEKEGEHQQLHYVRDGHLLIRDWFRNTPNK